MKNLIKQIRADILKHFDENALIPETEEIHYSPDNKYFFKSNFYQQTDDRRFWIVAKIEIFNSENNEKIFEFIRNDDSLYFCWLSVDERKYLLLPEDLEGKSVLNLSTGELVSYSFAEDRFIWTEFYPSPDGKLTAIMGCNWASPYEIIVCDTSRPMELPYKILHRQESFQDKLEWIDHKRLRIIDFDKVEKEMTFE
jgi:hypothetical protein